MGFLAQNVQLLLVRAAPKRLNFAAVHLLKYFYWEETEIGSNANQICLSKPQYRLQNTIALAHEAGYDAFLLTRIKSKPKSKYICHKCTNDTEPCKKIVNSY